MACRRPARIFALWPRCGLCRSSSRRSPIRWRVCTLSHAFRLALRRARHRGLSLLRLYRAHPGHSCSLDASHSSHDCFSNPSRRMRPPPLPHDSLPMTALNTAPIPQVDVVGVGLNATDTLIPLAEFPARGSKVEFESASILPGGEVASAIVACQTWGLRTRYVGKFGDDYAAQIHRAAFERAGVETHLFTSPGCPSYQSFILIDATGERTVLRRHDDRLALHPADLQREWISTARALLVDGHDTPAARLAARWAREAKIPVVADLDKLYPAIDTLL